MKTAVVYYSLDGSTREAAKLIAQRYGADMYELEEVKKRSGKPLSFMAAGFSALIGKRSRLKQNPAGKMGEYGTIYLGSPIWAARTVPAVNAFLCKLKAAGKQIVLFTLQADPNPSASKGVQKLINRLDKQGATVSSVIRLHGTKPGETASMMHLKQQLDRTL
jgi:menaquinone-dependent protoporphyrinogen IX oxidase